MTVLRVDRAELRSQTFEEFLTPDMTACLRRYALSLTRNLPDADDLVQETLCSALAAFESFRQGSDFKAWIIVIMRNNFINWRRRSYVKKVELREQLPDVPYDGIDALHAVSMRESATALREHLDRISPDIATTFVLNVVGELSYEEVASKMGCPIGTVMSRIFRARRRLRDLLTGCAA